jgi:hypothetical protein
MVCKLSQVRPEIWITALSTEFQGESRIFQSRYGTMIIDIKTLAIVGNTFRVRKHSIDTTFAVEPSNFPLVNAFYHDQGKTSMYSAQG